MPQRQFSTTPLLKHVFSTTLSHLPFLNHSFSPPLSEPLFLIHPFSCHHPFSTTPFLPFRKLLNHLFEHKQWSSELKPKIKSYLYNNRSASSPYDLGLSTVGTLHSATAEHHIDARLSTSEATLLTTGVVAFYFDAVTKEMVLLLSSIRMAMFAIEEQLDGYASGSLQVDWTYGISKEKIPLMTMGVCDVKQHGRLVAFGPTRFETASTVRLATKGFKAFLDRVCRILISGKDEPLWHPSVSAELRAKYEYLVVDLKKLGGCNVDDDAMDDDAMPPLVNSDDEDSAPASLANRPPIAHQLPLFEAAAEAAAEEVAQGELRMHTRAMPPAPPATPVDEMQATLEAILVPALEKTGDSPREARHNVTRTRASLAAHLPLAPVMRVGDYVEVAGCNNSCKVHPAPTPNPNPKVHPAPTLHPNQPTLTLTLTLP